MTHTRKERDERIRVVEWETLARIPFPNNKIRTKKRTAATYSYIQNNATSVKHKISPHRKPGKNVDHEKNRPLARRNLSASGQKTKTAEKSVIRILSISSNTSQPAMIH